MGRSRVNRHLPLIAALGLLTASCTGAPPSVSGTPTPTPSASAPSPAASPTADASATPAPSASPSVAPVETTLLRGKVFDDLGAAVADGTRVSVRSLDSTRPFEASMDTAAGLYAITQVPIDTQIEISATRPGWTTRRRVEVLVRNTQQVTTRNLVNFGGPTDSADLAGPAYYLSNYPEVESITPVDDATSLDNSRMTLKLVMSEPLDEINRRRLASAFLIVPNNDAAIADATSLPAETATATVDELKGLYAGSSPATTSAYRYRQNSGFLNGFVTSDFKWEPDGRTANFTLEAPVKTGKSREGKYALLFVQQDELPIVDAENKPFGMTAANLFGVTAKTNVLRNTIKESEVSLAAAEMVSLERRWADTHKSYAVFSFATDTTAPKVSSVIARRDYVDDSGAASDRVEVTFNEPMIAYPLISGSELLSLNNYTLATAKTLEEIETKLLKSDGTATTVNAGTGIAAVRTALNSTNGMVMQENGSVMTGGDGNFSIALSVKDPKVVVLKLAPGSLPLDANYIKVWVGTDFAATGGTGKPVTDAAGNTVEAKVQTGSIQ